MIFFKLSSLGNSFIVLINQNNLRKKKIIELCSWQFGIGADGVLIINTINQNVPSVRIFNSDGSEAKMCGNGLKIVAYVLQNILFLKLPLVVLTKSGKKEVGRKGRMYYVKVKCPKTLSDPKTDFPFAKYNAGNEHLLKLVSTIKTPELIKEAQDYHHQYNVSYISIDSQLPYLLTYERGAGLTLSCGSAALCAFAYLKNTGYKKHSLCLSCPGGKHFLFEEGRYIKLCSHVKFIIKGVYYGTTKNLISQ